MRLQGWDYSQEGVYFITVCTRNREYLFGEIVDGLMHLNASGEMVLKTWEELPERFPFMQSDARVLMPNHLHAILVITRRGEPCVRPDESGISPSATHSQNMVHIDQGDHPDQGEHKVRPYEKIPLRGTTAGSIGRIVQAFKSITTQQSLRGIREYGWQPFPGKLWQRNYYEHIMRNEDEWERIREYIAINPGQWAMDRENRDAGKTRPAEPW